MCLDFTKDIEVKKNTGFKFVEVKRIKGRLRLTSSLGSRLIYKLNRWIEDLNQGELKCDGPKGRRKFYPTGFHIFLDEAGAQSWAAGPHDAIVEVKFKTVVAKGTQHGLHQPETQYPVVVARKILMMSRTARYPNGELVFPTEEMTERVALEEGAEEKT